MNWFQRHLNLTWLITWLSYPIVAMIFISVNKEFASFFALLVYLYMLCLFIITIWVLKNKSRSLWWLLIPYSWLLLSNKNEQYNKDISKID